MLTDETGIPKPKPAMPKAMPAATVGTAPKPAAQPEAPKPTTITNRIGDGFNPWTPGAPAGAPSAAPAAVPGGTILTHNAPGPVPTQIPVNPIQPTTPSPTPTPQPGGVPGAVGLTPTNANNPLTAQTITPGALADRVGQANAAWNTWVQSTEPSYQAALRQATRAGAAAGGLGSGQLRTTYGDLGATRANAMDVKGQELLQGALAGQNEDVWRALGLAERQQGFHNTQQQQGFENELRRLGFDDAMLNSAMGRALMQWQAGQAGGTGSGTAMQGAGVFGGQGADALAALFNLTRQQAAAPRGPSPDTAPAGSIYPWMGGGVNG